MSGAPDTLVDFQTGNSIIVKNVPRSTNADVWDEWADEDEYDDFLSPEMRERLKALDAETAPPVDKCPIQHDLGDDDALKCSKDWVNAIVSDAGICPFSLSAAVYQSNGQGASPARVASTAAFSPRNDLVHPTHRLICAQVCGSGGPTFRRRTLRRDAC